MIPIVAYIQPTVEVVKNRSEQYEAHLDFPVNKSVILTDFMNNHSELVNIHSMFDKIQNDKNLTVQSISIEGFASPEGPLAFNEQLSKKRAEALKDYLVKNEKASAKLYKVTFGGAEEKKTGQPMDKKRKRQNYKTGNFIHQSFHK